MRPGLPDRGAGGPPGLPAPPRADAGRPVDGRPAPEGFAVEAPAPDRVRGFRARIGGVARAWPTGRAAPRDSRAVADSHRPAGGRPGWAGAARSPTAGQRHSAIRGTG